MPQTNTLPHELIDLLVDQIRPNPFNPNHMSDEEFAQYKAEVKRLGRPPKPCVVREVEDGYAIAGYVGGSKRESQDTKFRIGVF